MKTITPSLLLRQIAAVFASSLLLPLICHAQLEPDGGDDTNYTTLGSLYAGSTVGVESSYEGENIIASGILIDPYYVLTAAHYASGGGSIFRVIMGSNLYFPTASASAQNVLIYPGYSGTVGNSIDIAIVHLSSPLGNNTLNFAAHYVRASADPHKLRIPRHSFNGALF